MNQYSVDVRNLHKNFGHTPALRGVDLQLSPGEVLGFLGPNGAGKSTTIRVLLGLLKANSGSVSILGKDPWRDVVELHRRLTYVPGDVNLWPSMTGGEAIDLLGSLRGGLNNQRREELIERFELDPTKKGRQYSKGNRQKVAIIAALASDAELLILDEPTSGLDPLMENVFQQCLAERKAEGTSILLSSHILAEVEELADRVSIIRQGQIVRTGTLQELRGDAISVVHASVSTRPAEGTSLAGVETQWEGNKATAHVESARIQDVLEALLPLGVEHLEVEPPSLEAMFLDLYETNSHGNDEAAS